MPIKSDITPQKHTMTRHQMYRATGWVLFGFADNQVYNRNDLENLAAKIGNDIYQDPSNEEDIFISEAEMLHRLTCEMWEPLTVHFGDDLARETWPVINPMPEDVRKNLLAAKKAEPVEDTLFSKSDRLNDPYAFNGTHFHSMVQHQVLKRKDQAKADALSINLFLQDKDPILKTTQPWAVRSKQKPEIY